MIKNFVLDTGILLASPYSLHAFDEHNLYITYDSIAGLMDKRKTNGETAASAREALRLIADIMQNGGKLPGGGKLRIMLPETYGKLDGEFSTIKAVKALIAEGKHNAVLVSNNSATKIMAITHGIPVEPYLREQVAPPLEQFKGRRETVASAEFINELYSKGEIAVGIDQFDGGPLVENEYFIIHNACEPERTALASYSNGKLRPLGQEQHPYGVKPRKVGQRFAIDALMDPNIQLVILKGPAGTAKTFLTMAAALEQTLNTAIYDRILVTRPNIKFDNDIGFLKGTEEEKIGPLIRPVMDNLELLCRTKDTHSKDGFAANSYVNDLFSRGIIAAQAMAYMRGRSISNTFVVLDEGQNMSPTQAFGIISRIGIGSKVVIAGDPEQIDNPELDSRNNGLSYASEKMRGSPICAQITFEPEECVRSQLALEAIRRMSNRPSGN